MREIARIVVGGLQVAQSLTQMLVKDIEPASFACLPRAGNEPIQTNHPAFIFGHLSLYPAHILENLGADPAEARAPEGFESIFHANAECKDDPNHSLYPPMEQIMHAFYDTHGVLQERIADYDDQMLAGPNPQENMLKEWFPTIGGLITFQTCSHVMMHLGQVSTWRRCMGLGPAM